VEAVMSEVWLVPFDFSVPSRAAARLAADEVLTHGDATLVLFHAFMEPHVPGSYKWARSEGFTSQDELYEALMDEVSFSLKDVANELRSDHEGLHVEIVVDRGDPRDLILSRADDLDARRIVMGTQGRTGLPHLMIGSVAETVVRMAKMPVTVVKGDS
jgi:nucleotide-binding universal stress UspA family protein